MRARTNNRPNVEPELLLALMRWECLRNTNHTISRNQLR